MSPTHTLLAGLAALSMVPFIASPAEAKIRCNGRYQLTSLGEVSTPYCEDHLLTKVARARGYNVTFAQVHNNWGVKKRVCYGLRYHPIVGDICTGIIPDHDGPNIIVP